MQTVYQLDDQGLLLHEREAPTKGHLQVMVAPPEVPAGHVARWVTALHPVIDTKTYGDPGTGAWEVIEDHRKDSLWLGHGKPYTLGADADGQTYDGLGPVPAWLYDAEPPAPEPTLAEAQAAQLVLINASFEAAAQALTAGYPEAERLTWPIQQAEALAWAADNTAPTPYLDGLADARGITPAEMRALTLAQVQAFQAASQQLVGTRQRLRDEINAAATVADVRAVVWPSGGEA
ncbi:hypothetical protein ABRY94_11655 [Castellaniella ginsengisoli]|uniref:DUF4376 domain-containing protein n=1 Tax=Castellaniella ginsengisoli TaxID=546114 RepID=A0AB39EPN5_9BURK